MGTNGIQLIMKRLGVFCCFDADGVIDDYVLHILRATDRVLDRLIIVANGVLNDEGRRKLSEFTDEIIVRPNTGFDAAAWRQGLVEQCGWTSFEQFDELILFNDSFFGPFYPFTEVFERMAEEHPEADFWGLSVHGAAPAAPGLGPYGNRPRYLQTYFVVFRSRLIHSEIFRTYWNEQPEYESFKLLVEKFSAPMTRYFEERGFHWATYSDTTDLETEIPYNICHHAYNLYDMLVCRRYPIIKRKSFSLPKEAYLKFNDSSDLRRSLEYIANNTDYDIGLIFDYLLRRGNANQLKDVLNLNFILSEDASQEVTADGPAVVAAHLSNADQFESAAIRLNGLPSWIDLSITTDSEDKRTRLAEMLSRKQGGQMAIRVVAAPGGAWEAWLMHSADDLKRYSYIGFVHDEQFPENAYLSSSLSHQNILWDSMFGSSSQIMQLFRIFERYPRIGLVAPPPVTHGEHLGQTWKSWSVCSRTIQELAMRLNLSCKVDKSIMPMTRTAVFWCRAKVLQPFFDYDEWQSVDFAPPAAGGKGTLAMQLSYLLPYAAQSEGFLSASAMGVRQAETELTNQQFMLQTLTDKLFTIPKIKRNSFMDLVNSLGKLKTNPAGIPSLTGRVKAGFKERIKKYVPLRTLEIYRRMRRFLRRVRQSDYLPPPPRSPRKIVREKTIESVIKRYSPRHYRRAVIDSNHPFVTDAFSHFRHNCVAWLPLTKSDRVLELESNFGELTGFLAERAKEVVSCDANQEKLKLNRRRHGALTNIRFMAAPPMDVVRQLDKEKFNYILLIGGLDEARRLSQDEDAHRKLLAQLRPLLAPEGKIVVASGNRFGLKYWAGSREEKTSRFFEGLEGYPHQEGVKTFSRRELMELLSAGGYNDVQFYYPYPDYRFTKEIYSDRFLPSENTLSMNDFWWEPERLKLFNEKRVFNNLLEERMFPFFANSFLITAGNEPETRPDGLRLIYSRSSNDRGERYGIRTDILEDASGRREVRKYPAQPEAWPHVEDIYQSYLKLKEQYADTRMAINHCELCDGYLKFEYLQGGTLWDEILETFRTEGQAAGEARLCDFLSMVRAGADQPFQLTPEFDKIFGAITFPEDLFCLKYSDIDMIPGNVVPDGEKFHLLDYEWTFDFPIPVDFLIFRSIFYFCKYVNIANKNLLRSVNISDSMTKKFMHMERMFVKYIRGGTLPINILAPPNKLAPSKNSQN